MGACSCRPAPVPACLCLHWPSKTQRPESTRVPGGLAHPPSEQTNRSTPGSSPNPQRAETPNTNRNGLRTTCGSKHVSFYKTTFDVTLAIYTPCSSSSDQIPAQPHSMMASYVCMIERGPQLDPIDPACCCLNVETLNVETYAWMMGFYSTVATLGTERY